MLAELEDWEDEQLLIMADEALAEDGEPEQSFGQIMDEMLSARADTVA